MDMIKRILDKVKITSSDGDSKTNDAAPPPDSSYKPSLSSGVYGFYPSVVYKSTYTPPQKAQAPAKKQEAPSKPSSSAQASGSSSLTNKQWIYHPDSGYVCVSWNNNEAVGLNTTSSSTSNDIVNVNSIKTLLQNESNIANAIHKLSSRLPFTSQTNDRIANDMVTDLMKTNAISLSGPKKSHATLIFIRHGQSKWNASNQFTGWVDVGLTDLGKKEAMAGAMELKKAGYQFDCMFTSYLKRAIKTGQMVLGELNQLYIPVHKSWRLNERMYGGLQGLNKVDTVKKHGKEKVLQWRRSFDIPPPKIDKNSKYNPAKEKKYRKVNKKNIPKTECLKDVIERVIPYWEKVVKPELVSGKTILVAAHGNSIRAILKYLDHINDKTIPSLEIPTGIPLVYEFDRDLNIIKNKKAVPPLTGLFLGDPERIKKAQDKVKNQISKK
eukprot:439698_1